MDKKMLSALEKDARLTPRELSVMFAREEESVRGEIEACEKDGTILGYRTVVNWDKVGREAVSALIELKITPVRDRGFDAVFVGTGAGLPSYLGIEGEGLNGVSVASELLTRVNLMKAYQFPEYETPVYAGKKCVVVGGGKAGDHRRRGFHGDAFRFAAL